MTLIPFRWLVLPYGLIAAVLFVLDVLWARQQAVSGQTSLVRVLWGTEHWIGGPAHKELRQKAAQWCFTAAVAVFTLRLMLGYSTIENTTMIQAVMFDLTMLLLQAKIILLSQYSYRQLFTAGIILLPFFAAQITIPYHMMIICYLMVVAAKDMDLRSTLKVFTAVIIAFSVVLAVLSGLGIIRPYLSFVPGVYVGTAFGFTNVNLAAMFLSDVAAALFMLNFHKLKWQVSVPLLALMIYVFIVVLKCKGGVVAIAVAVLMYLIYRFAPRFFKSSVMKWLCMASPLIGCALWFIVSALYNPDSSIWAKLNYYSTGRLDLCSRAFKTFPIELIVTANRYTAELSTAENIFFETLYKLGLISLVITLIFAVWMVHRLYKRQAWAELIIYMGMLAFGMFELFSYYAYFNAIVWLGASMLFGLPAERMNLFAKNPEVPENAQKK